MIKLRNDQKTVTLDEDREMMAVWRENETERKQKNDIKNKLEKI